MVNEDGYNGSRELVDDANGLASTIRYLIEQLPDSERDDQAIASLVDAAYIIDCATAPLGEAVNRFSELQADKSEKGQPQ